MQQKEPTVRNLRGGSNSLERPSSGVTATRVSGVEGQTEGPPWGLANPWEGLILGFLLGNHILGICLESEQRSSHCGPLETNLTCIHEDVGSTPGLAHWVGDPTLP